MGSVAYLALLRWLTGVRWRDLSQDARFVMVSATLLLIVFLAFGRSGTYHRVFEQFVPRDARTPLFAFVYFAASSVILRFAVPYLLVRFKLREAPRDFGYVVRGGTRWRWAYFGLFVGMVPIILWASTRPDFQSSYPQARGIVAGTEVSVQIFIA